MPIEIYEEINLTTGNYTNMSFEILNQANREFTINVTATFDNEELIILGTGEYTILGQSTSYVNISYYVDLWSDTTNATGILTFNTV